MNRFLRWLSPKNLALTSFVLSFSGALLALSVIQPNGSSRVAQEESAQLSPAATDDVVPPAGGDRGATAAPTPTPAVEVRVPVVAVAMAREEVANRQATRQLEARVVESFRAMATTTARTGVVLGDYAGQVENGLVQSYQNLGRVVVATSAQAGAKERERLAREAAEAATAKVATAIAQEISGAAKTTVQQAKEATARSLAAHRSAQRAQELTTILKTALLTLQTLGTVPMIPAATAVPPDADGWKKAITEFWNEKGAVDLVAGPKKKLEGYKIAFSVEGVQYDSSTKTLKWVFKVKEKTVKDEELTNVLNPFILSLCDHLQISDDKKMIGDNFRASLEIIGGGPKIEPVPSDPCLPVVPCPSACPCPCPSVPACHAAPVCGTARFGCVRKTGGCGLMTRGCK